MSAQLSKHVTTLILILFALVALPVFTARARSWLKNPSQSIITSPLTPPTSEALSQEPEEQIEVEAVSVTPFGFEPAEITRSHEPFLLALHNHSGERNLLATLPSAWRQNFGSESVARQEQGVPETQPPTRSIHSF